MEAASAFKARRYLDMNMAFADGDLNRSKDGTLVVKYQAIRSSRLLFQLRIAIVFVINGVLKPP